MAREEEIRKEREKKLKELIAKGIDPYAHSFNVKDKTAELQKKYEKLKPGEKKEEKARVAGRIISIREHGKIAFATLQDSTGKIQLFLEKNIPNFDFFKRYIDTGDIIGCEGKIFRTARGELSIAVEDFKLLTKSLAVLPEKWHGLQDKELRYRQRYLDLIVNPHVKEIFLKRSTIIEAMRKFLLKRGYVEVETPILQPIYGGTNARPFETFLHALKMKLYLRISNELYLKRLLVGGYEKLFEFSPDFRNEGIDRLHNPEFLQLETMHAYVDYRYNMKLFQELIAYVAKQVLGKTKISYQGKELDLARWKKLSMLEAIENYTGLNFDCSESNARKLAIKAGVSIEDCSSWGEIVEKVFSELVEPKLQEPHIIYDMPASNGLAKLKHEDNRLAERFEPFVAGFELGNSYSEENDPKRIEAFWRKAEQEFKKGKIEAQRLDIDFIKALEYGMPPASGLGIGIDRLVMLFTDSASIRDVILFLSLIHI